MQMTKRIELKHYFEKCILLVNFTQSITIIWVNKFTYCIRVTI